MITKVIFFTQVPFTPNDYERLGIDLIEQNGFEVEVWDLSTFLYPEVYRLAEAHNSMSHAKCRRFATQREAQAAIAKLPRSCFVVCVVNYRYQTYTIYRALSKARLAYAVTATNTLPTIQVTRRPADIFAKLKQSSVSMLLNAAFARTPYRLLGVRPATVAIVGGEQSFVRNYPIASTTRMLWTHNWDYDTYLIEQDKPTQPDANRGVFLDEYLPFHPDLLYIVRIDLPTSPADYFASVRRFFDRVESQYGVQVTVAAHPKSNYEALPDYFGGRPVVKGQTASLVRNSRFVITHMSTAVDFAVLFNKPLLFVTTAGLQRSPWFGRAIDTMATWLGKTPIDMDDPRTDWEHELTIDQAAYTRYRQAFIKKSDSPDKPGWQIVADFLKTFSVGQSCGGH
jgi:hypothetical protein